MTEIDKDERKYIYAALLVTIQNASDLETVQRLIDQGRQALVLIPSGMARGDHDAITEQLVDLVDDSEAILTAVQVDSTRPKGWPRWLARLNATRTFVVRPKSLGDPSVAVFWAPEAETGLKRLLVVELKTFKYGFREP